MPTAANLGLPEQAALDEFSSWIRSRFGDRLRELRLFGSRARGEGHEDSDLDVLVVIDGLESKEAREIAHRSGDALTEHDVLLAPLALSTERWETLRRRGRRLVREIDRDGIDL